MKKKNVSLPYPAGEIAGIDKKAFFCFILGSKSGKFQARGGRQCDARSVCACTKYVFTYLYITSSVRVLFLRSSLQGISRHPNQMSRTSLTLSFYMLLALIRGLGGQERDAWEYGNK